MSIQRDHASFVGDLLRQADPDLYFSTLVLPASKRTHVQTVFAFSAEVSCIRQKVSQPLPGEIRLQYWVDLLNGSAHGQTPDNPLAASLMQTIDRFNLPAGPLLRLLAARRFDLYDDPMPDIETFEGYAGETHSILFQIASLVLSGGEDTGAADAAGHLGVAHCLVRHLRSMPYDAGRGQIFLPLEVFQASGASEKQLFARKPTPGIVQSCARLRELARQHLAKAQDACGQLPADIRPVFALISVLEAQLTRLEKTLHTPFAPAPDLANWRKIARILVWSVRN